jgi:hypothetical protein
MHLQDFKDLFRTNETKGPCAPVHLLAANLLLIAFHLEHQDAHFPAGYIFLGIDSQLARTRSQENSYYCSSHHHET